MKKLLVATPNSNLVNISMGKQAPMIVGGEMHASQKAARMPVHGSGRCASGC